MLTPKYGSLYTPNHSYRRAPNCPAHAGKGHEEGILVCFVHCSKHLWNDPFRRSAPKGRAHSYFCILAPGWGRCPVKMEGWQKGTGSTHRQEAQLASTPGLEPHGRSQVDLHQRAGRDFLLCTFRQVHSAQSHVDV